MLVNALLLQGFNDLDLGCNTCMIGSGLPQCIVALHSLITDQNILHGVIQCMSHMELSGNIWGRNDNRKRGLAVIYFCMKVFLCKPLVINTIFHFFRVVGLCQFFAHHVLLFCYTDIFSQNITFTCCTKFELRL